MPHRTAVIVSLIYLVVFGISSTIDIVAPGWRLDTLPLLLFIGLAPALFISLVIAWTQRHSHRWRALIPSVVLLSALPTLSLTSSIAVRARTNLFLRNRQFYETYVHEVLPQGPAFVEFTLDSLPLAKRACCFKGVAQRDSTGTVRAYLVATRGSGYLYTDNVAAPPLPSLGYGLFKAREPLAPGWERAWW